MSVVTCNLCVSMETFRKYGDFPNALKGQSAHSPGQRPGEYSANQKTP